MTDLKIKNRKLAKMGRHYHFSIPKLYVDNDQIDPSKKYTLIIVEEKPMEVGL
jgi:hypothetical protein